MPLKKRPADQRAFSRENRESKRQQSRRGPTENGQWPRLARPKPSRPWQQTSGIKEAWKELLPPVSTGTANPHEQRSPARPAPPSALPCQKKGPTQGRKITECRRETPARQGVKQARFLN